MARTIIIEDMITVGALADRLSLPVTKLIGELMKNGVLATVNEKIDFDTAQIIVGELGLDIELAREEKDEAPVKKERVYSDHAAARPPVVAVMGHVDHGKTSLLDAIRQADVAAHEAGGITQHISAYQIRHNDRLITFLDTPGHEAFAALREHGAHLTDLVIIVVAADDGIKPQTLEAIRFARKAGVKMIVAANKIDKEGANIDRLKQQLAEQNMLIEEWGGDTIVLPVSAKTKQGIPELLDMVLLMADVEELKADTDVPAEGMIIESHMEQGRGPVATALIQQGTLATGEFIVAGSSYAKVRVLRDSGNKQIAKAGPSTPVEIVGFKTLPQFGDQFAEVKSEKEARLAVEKAHSSAKASLDMTSSELLRMISRKTQVTELNIIVKADVFGSLTSVVDSLKGLDTDEVAIRVVGSGVGPVTENDIRLAETSKALIYGFNVTMPVAVKQLSARDKVSVRLFKVIYELIDDVRQELSALLAPEIIETEIGTLVVKGIFKTTKTEVVCGGEVTKGKLVVPAQARVVRDKEPLGEVEVVGLKRGPQDAKEILEGEMCGVSFKTDHKIVLEEGDRLIFFSRETKIRTL